MNNPLNILLVRRTEVENKWWHRLFTVLLLGSGTVVFILTILLTVDSYNHIWVTNRPIAFSLEPNYQQASGKEFPCHENADFLSISANEPISDAYSIRCDDVSISKSDARQYEGLYQAADKNLQKQFGLDKYSGGCNPATVSGSWVDCIKASIADKQADPAYPEYQNSLKNLARIKAVQDINYSLMFSDIAFWIAIPISALLLWIAFWSAIVYRAILYVVYGKKR